MRRAGGRAAAMEWAAGWSKIAASTARERPGAALAVVASVAAALPVMLVALVFAAVAFAALALPLGIATAAWWVTLRPRARGRDSPSSILTRLREGTLRLSAVPEGSAEPGSARASLASPRASLTPAGLRLGNPPVDLLVVYSGQTEFKMEGCDDAARMVAARIKEKVEAQHTRSRHARYHDTHDTEHHRDALAVGDGVSVALADVSSLCDASDEKKNGDFDLATALADFADAVVFVVESAVCVETPSDALRKFRRRLQRELACVSGDAARFFASTRRGRCAPFCVVAVSRSVGGPEGEKGGSAFCGARAGGEAGRAFDKALGVLLGADELPTGAELPDGPDGALATAESRRSVTERSTSGRRLCARCDAEIERHGPGVVDRWAREVLYPSLFGRFGNPAPPRVLSLSSTHTALLLRHLGARDRVVGCDPWFEETPGTSPNASNAPIPRVDAFAPDLDVIRRLDPTLVVCAYASVADALRAAAPAWDLRAGDAPERDERRDSPVGGRDAADDGEAREKRAPQKKKAAADSDSEDQDSELSFEIVTLECPLGRDALERSAAQIVELAAHARLDPARARAAAEKLRSGVLAIRARAERAFGGDAARFVSDADAGVTPVNPKPQPQPFVFIEADPDLFSADSCTPLGAALAEGLGVGNVADPVADPRRIRGAAGDAADLGGGARTVGADPDAAARAAAALAKRMGREEDAQSFLSQNDDDASHYPRLPAARFWTPREPDWWIVAHPTAGGASGTSFADALDAEDRDRHAALREGRVVTLSDALCHAASQWTPELVDVVEAVFQKMLAYREARERERGESDETEAIGTKKKCVSRRSGETEAANADSNADSDAIEDATRGGFTADNATRASDDDVLDARFRDRNLRALPASALALDLPPLRVTALDLSRNELSELPGLAALAPTLRVLNLERNWFSRVPEEVGALRALMELNLSRNFLRPGDDALALDALRALPGLRVLDLRWNRKVHTVETLRRLTARLAGGDAASRERSSAAGTEDGPKTSVPSNSVDVRVTVSFPAPAGAFVGSSPADRDASRLRAQLEPWSTLALRRRLVEDFGADPASVEDPERVPRAEVVTRLLAAYAREGLVDVASSTSPERAIDFVSEKEGDPSRPPRSIPEQDFGVGRRRTVRTRGAPVSAAALDDLRALMRAWLARRASKGARGNVQERPSVCAQAYMILRSPTDFNAKLGAGSRKARQAADKFAAHASLWRGAERALREADPAFADAFTALAVTYGFQGSPHIDKQNVGPFYALALGDFDEGTGGVAVEADARTVCVVDTKNRLGKVDGRFPHWVTPWDARGGKERFSLIYYRTAGEPEPITSAAFDEHGRGVHVDPEGSEASDESGEERRI